MSSIVIVGAGECGGRAALQLREYGFDGAITLVGSEEHAPYERPPLSKDGLAIGAPPRFIAEHTRYVDGGIDLRTGTTAKAIDRAARTVRLSDRSNLSYDRMLLATGSRPRTLPGLAEGSPRVFTLRSHADALRIRPHLRDEGRIVIVGGGFIGLELAAAARGLGATVTIIEGLLRILSRGVPPEIADAVAARHAAAGVDILCGQGLEALKASDDDVRVTLKDGRVLVADIAVIGIASIPNVELAAAAGLLIDNGIAVDDQLRTSDPLILAAGDCCSFPLALYDGRRIRLESWRSAQEQALLAAANLTGADEMLGSVPWFWSDQYDLTLQVAGLADGATVSVRRDIAVGAFIVFHISAAGRLLAASGIGLGNAVARDIRLAEMLIASGKAIDPAALADPGTRLKTLLSA